MSYIRRTNGFVRYAIALQYHGRTFLGFSAQGNQEDSILPDGTDLRGRMRGALNTLVGEDNYENFFVSSRTDRGVHAIKNTCHVDIRPRKITADEWDPTALHRGINFYLARQQTADPTMDFMNQLRIIAVKNVPPSMKNVFYNGTEQNGPEFLDWHARFSATERTYVYRILHNNESFALPFEWDRSLMINDREMLNVDAMNEAARHLVGTLEISSFRAQSVKEVLLL
jgi:tRNA pseudouridine38-40 synthase